ncbi:MAG TPA: FAD-binding oxidoreductase [Micromonosporaceae bacterium]|jgi:glycolate oxidase FAD binding subunit
MHHGSDRPGGDGIARRLAQICGPGFVREAGPADSVAGVPAHWVAAPGSIDAVATLLGLVADRDLSVVARGAGTKLDWGAPPSHVDLVLDTGRLAGVWHHAAAEQLAEVGAGTPIRAIQATLARAGQRLALDPASPGATLGGVVVTDESGPLRHRHGSPCDQLVGASYVRAGGALEHTELAAASASAPAEHRDDQAPDADRGTEAERLCGSYGALGVLVSATVRTQPLPSAAVWVVRSVWTPLEVHDLVAELLAAPVRPAAIEVNLPATSAPLPHQRSTSGRGGAGSLGVLLEGRLAEVAARAAELIALLRGDAATADAAPPWWGRYPFGADDVALHVTVPITDLHAAVYALRDAAGVPVPVRGRAGVGEVFAALPGRTAPDRVAAILAAVRGVLLARGGSCVVLAAPSRIRAAVDLWGDLPRLADLRETKERFDPGHLLAPGRYPGGI